LIYDPHNEYIISAGNSQEIYITKMFTWDHVYNDQGEVLGVFYKSVFVNLYVEKG